MKQLIYHSRPFGFDRSALAGILLEARRNNLRDEITGALVCRHDLYIQLVEGPDTAIDNLYSKIAVDDRHCDVRLAHSGEVEDRMFPDWEMLDDSMPSMTWSSAEIEGGSIDQATPEEMQAVFRKIAIKART